MPDLDFTVEGVKPASHGMIPLIEFEMRVRNRPADERIQAIALHIQIQIECPKRPYDKGEKEKLLELFGEPERWGGTLRNRLWTHVDTTVPPFSGETTARFTVPCSFDLNLASAKYFYALGAGEVPLLFLYSGTVFFEGEDGRLQVARISWDKEGSFRLPVEVWKETIDYHYPNKAWVMLDRDVFERLYAFKRERSITTWEETLERLMPENTERKETVLV